MNVRLIAPAILLLASGAASAQIVLKPTGEDAVTLKPRTVDVRIALRDGVASTVWTYAFANDERWRGQADFLLRVPDGGVAAGFAYWYRGERVAARVTEQARARRVYEAIVARQRDPALIELVGKNTFRVRIFPIDPKEDLKVEVSFVQALDGPTLNVPLRALGKVERATVSVESQGKTLSSWSPDPVRHPYRIANSTVPDLRVTEAWTPQALHAFFRSGTSGGDKAFFVASLTPSGPLTHRRWRLEGAVDNVVEVPFGRSLLLVGRCRPNARVRAWVMGDGYKAHADFQTGHASEPNGVATKLWAWNRIRTLRRRQEIVALSLRFGVPSRYTSWIAIPPEERRRMAREIAEADLRHDVESAMPRLSRVGLRSPEGRRIVGALFRQARARGVWLEGGAGGALQKETDRQGARWARAVSRHGEGSAEARAADADLQVLRRLGGWYSRDAYYLPRGQALALRLVEDRAEGRKGREFQSRSQELTRLAGNISAYGSPESARTVLLQQAARSRIEALAREAVDAERNGKSDTATVARLGRIAALSGDDAREILRHRRIGVAYDELSRMGRPVAKALDSGDSADIERLRADAPNRARETAILKANHAESYYAQSEFQSYAGLFTARVEQGLSEPEEQAKVQARIDRVAAAAGLDASLDWPQLWRGTYYNVRLRRDREALEARRDLAKLRAAEDLLARIETHVDDRVRREYSYTNVRFDRNETLRNDYVRARHEGRPADGFLQRLFEEDSKPEYAFGGWDEHPAPVSAPVRAAARRDLLRTLTELDDLDRQTPDPEVLEHMRRLESEAKELRARMGDPIVRVDAPQARSVVARLPDGSPLVLHRAADGRWEGRFDVPPIAKDGRYEIVVAVDGVESVRVPITVDTRAPVVSVVWRGGRAEVTTEADVRRITGLTPDGSRLDLTLEAPGRFGGIVPPGTRFVATDAAHNRSDSAAAPPRASVDRSSGWAGGVTTLARVEDRLWIGTLNEGGGFEGESADPGRPWIKAAVALGSKLALRTADGKVFLDGAPVRLSRDATAIAADGERLLVGTIGGFYDGERSIFPRELAGIVVTALLGDGDRVWIGTQGRGIAEVDRRTGRLRWHDERAGLGDDWITCLGRNDRGQVVAGTFVAGAYVHGDSSWGLVPGTAGTCVSGIGGRWIATRQGVFAGGTCVNTEEATAFLLDDGQAWIGTRRGVLKLKVN